MLVVYSATPPTIVGRTSARVARAAARAEGRRTRGANDVPTARIDGFDGATLAKQSADGLYRVAYGRFESKREAIRLYYFLVNSLPLFFKND